MFVNNVSMGVREYRPVADCRTPRCRRPPCCPTSWDRGDATRLALTLPSGRNCHPPASRVQQPLSAGPAARREAPASVSTAARWIVHGGSSRRPRQGARCIGVRRAPVGDRDRGQNPRATATIRHPAPRAERPAARTALRRARRTCCPAHRQANGDCAWHTVLAARRCPMIMERFSADWAVRHSAYQSAVAPLLDRPLRRVPTLPPSPSWLLVAAALALANPRGRRAAVTDRRDRSQLCWSTSSSLIGERSRLTAAAASPRVAGCHVGALLGRITATIARRWLG